MWNTDIDWPFKTPPTRDFLISQGLDIDQWHLLGLNESPMGPSPEVSDYMSAAMRYLNRYPDNVLPTLVKDIAQKTGILEECQIWGNGAGDLINRAVAIASQHNLNIVSPSPTFWGYERTYKLQQAQVTRTQLDANGAINIDKLLCAVNRNTGIVTFATPGNPSGVSLSAEAIETIARQTPDNVLLMIDEVYHEFCVHEGGPDALEIVRRVRTAPWVVLRSFSKAYQLAGARVGYGLASDPLTAKRLREHTLNFNISNLNYAAAIAAWRDDSSLQRYLEYNQLEKEFLCAQLKKLGLRVLESAANFIAVETPMPSVQLLAELRKYKIACAPWNHDQFDHFIRIGIGRRESSEAVVAALKAIITPT